MTCEKCRSANDADALFCANCGLPVGSGKAGAHPERGWNWRYLLLLAPVLLAVLAIGYYKFYLPQGVAAVVNGEKIPLSEVDAAVRDLAGGKTVPEEMRARMRSAVLSRLITERIAWQEAQKSGITVSLDDVNAAVERRRSASGMDEKAFEAQVRERYGSMGSFRKNMERQLLLGKYIDARVTAGASDAADLSARMDQWLQEITSKAEVRIALAEELPAAGAGCGCCNEKTGVSAGAQNEPGKGRGAATQGLSVRVREAQGAALAYWKGRHGDGFVDTKVRDFGCHIQVDIIKDNRVTASLRYQNGTITER